jgi:hypothetical protein
MVADYINTNSELRVCYYKRRKNSNALMSGIQDLASLDN